ncbi:MAG: hypothetical protein HGA44_05890 [Cellulomonadaceae bacterium]|nr:hypothetical protein [Cellulomonadaceae bacterium]
MGLGLVDPALSIEVRVAGSLEDARVVRRRLVTGGIIASFVGGGVFAVLAYLDPLWAVPAVGSGALLLALFRVKDSTGRDLRPPRVWSRGS